MRGDKSDRQTGWGNGGIAPFFFFGEISSHGHDPLLLECCGTDQCDDDETVKRFGFVSVWYWPKGNE